MLPNPAKLKVLHVTEAFGSGVFEVVRLIANAGAVGGDSVHVAYGLRPSTPPDFADLFDPRVRLHALRWGPTRSSRRLLAGTLDLWGLLRDEAWDVVHFHSTFAGIAGAISSSRNCPTVYTPHGYSFLMETLSPFAKRCVRVVEFCVAKRMTMIGAVSSAEAREARRIGANRVEVVYNGIPELDSGRIEGHLIGSQVVRRAGVISIGRMSPQRQPQAVARIFRSIKGLTTTSWVGDADDEEAAKLLNDAGAEITGWLPREDVLEQMRAARIYLHWTAWDGHPISVLEAISQGSVVIARDIPPVREILAAGQICGTEEEATERIQALLTDDTACADVQKAQLNGAERFSAEAMTTSWQSLYVRIVALGTGWSGRS